MEAEEVEFMVFYVLHVNCENTKLRRCTKNRVWYSVPLLLVFSLYHFTKLRVLWVHGLSSLFLAINAYSYEPRHISSKQMAVGQTTLRR
jgi:hypothetical protein